jgi:hypothetical protein
VLEICLSLGSWFLVVVYTVKHYCFTFFQQVIYSHFYLSFQWNTWSEILGAQTGSKPAAGAYIVKYLLYVLWAVLFAMLASLFVHSFAPCCLYCQALLLHIFSTGYIPFCPSVSVGVCVVQILKICFIENIIVHTI